MLELVSLHYKQTQLLQSERILEEFDVFEKRILDEYVPVVAVLLDFAPLDDRSSNADDGLLHFLSLLNPFKDQAYFGVRVKLQGIVRDPEVVVKLVPGRFNACSLFGLTESVGIFVFVSTDFSGDVRML